MIKLGFAVATAVCALFPNVALAKAQPAGRGYVAQLRSSGHVCLRATTDAEAARLGMPVRATRCHLPADWAALGLRIEVNGVRVA